MTQDTRDIKEQFEDELESVERLTMREETLLEFVTAYERLLAEVKERNDADRARQMARILLRQVMFVGSLQGRPRRERREKNVTVQ